jgi:hypothetical protein
LIVARAPDRDAITTLTRFQGQIVQNEIPANLGSLERLGGDIESLGDVGSMLPSAYAYTRHLLATCAQGDCAEGLTAVLPCQWSYGELARALGMEDRLGSLEPGRFADLLIVEKDRIMFPPGRYDAEPFLDVVLDRTDAGDIDTVMAHGRVLMEGGRVTVVDEGALKERFAEAVQRRVYRVPGHVQRWAELGRLVEPYAIDFYQRWYDTPVEPAWWIITGMPSSWALA